MAKYNYNQAKQQVTIQQLATQINSGQIAKQGLTLGAIGSSASSNPWIIGSSNPNTINLTGGIFMDEAQPHVKKYEVFETEQDILLLSVVWQRMRNERDELQINKTGALIAMPTNITDKILFQNIKSEDLEKTDKIRDYYSKKLMWWTLNEVRLSNFREDMKKLINSDGKIFQENIKPLAYRLPEFYDYDVMFDEMFMEHNTKTNQTKNNLGLEKKFTLVKTFVRKRRHSHIKEYWFSDENDNLNVINITKDNPLLNLFDLYSSKPFTIQGTFCFKIRDNREYFVVEKYSFS